MSKKKSLGSSPIAFKSKKSTMGFIPDRGVSNKKEETNTNNTTVVAKPIGNKETRGKESTSQKEKENQKKVVSYYLETDLVDKVKSMANKNDMYYSALVTSALKHWIARNN